MKKITIIGSGLGALSAALRLSALDYKIVIIEKNSTAGGRVNYFEENGFKFDIGPSFMSMTYELEELFNSIGIKNPIEMEELDPLYQVFFEGKIKPRVLWKNLSKLQTEFLDIEPNLELKVDNYLRKGGEIFNDTMESVVKTNYNSKLEYLYALSKVPLKHIPYLIKNVWSEVNKRFTSEELKMIFSLTSFFLGSTPFKTPAIYSLLNYTEMRHNGYWGVKGGMYSLIEEIIKILLLKGVEIIYNTEIVKVNEMNGSIVNIVDQNGKKWDSDIFVCNSDAASFRGEILGRKKYSEKKLDKMNWSLAPLTIYLGVKGKIDKLMLHNYFLGNNFKEYANTIFTAKEIPENPYYYVNALSKSTKECAPEGCENIFILCPVSDLRYKKSWEDKDLIADRIIDNLSNRVSFDIKNNIVVKRVYTPQDWGKMFNLYKGSGLGLSHDIDQVGAFRPKNKDEELKNLYYVGASTTPGTGLPMVIISSKLVTERIKNDFK